MTETKYGLKYLIGVALIAGTMLVAGCGGPDMTKTTTTDQSTTSSSMAPTTSTTTTSSTQQSHP